MTKRKTQKNITRAAPVGLRTKQFPWIRTVASEDLECESMDFDTAFLSADIPDEATVYVEQPTGLKEQGGKVCLIKKALYGLKPAPLWWFRHIARKMKALGFEQVDGAPCLLRHEETGVKLRKILFS